VELSVRLVKGSKSGGQVANIDQVFLAKNIIGFNTPFFLFIAKNMLLVLNIVFYIRQRIGKKTKCR